MPYTVELSPSAQADLERLFDFLLEQSKSREDLHHAEVVIEALSATLQHQLSLTPYSFRKAAYRPEQRELIIPFGHSGYVALFEIVSPSKVVVLAVRHQREEDYH